MVTSFETSNQLLSDMKDHLMPILALDFYSAYWLQSHELFYHNLNHPLLQN